ncbi:MAG: hypothetical protein ACK55Z_04715, partial [bacterium]
MRQLRAPRGSSAHAPTPAPVSGTGSPGWSRRATVPSRPRPPRCWAAAASCDASNTGTRTRASPTKARCGNWVRSKCARVQRRRRRPKASTRPSWPPSAAPVSTSRPSAPSCA